jgi:hypothetical protein
MVATPDSFSVELHSMPERHIVLPLDLSFTAAEMEGIACGFIPHSMDDKWFMYFIDGQLFMRRSWTGFLLFVVQFVQEGERWRATHAEVNRDREQYGNEDDDADRRLIAEMIDVHLVNPEPPHKDGFFAALELTAQPNYLGSPQVVRDVLSPVFATAVGRWVYLHVPPRPEVTHAQEDDACRQAEQVFSGSHPDYTAMPGWHSVEELGQAAIVRFGLDPDYCAGEDLFFIISESIAAVSLAINGLLNRAESPMRHLQGAVAQLHRMQEFVESVMLGTHTLRYPGLTLQDFGWLPGEDDTDGECDEEEDADNADEIEDEDDEEEE